MISDWHGQDPSAPAVRMEELVHARCAGCGGCTRDRSTMRAASTGCGSRRPGDVAPPREQIPIYTAGVNPRMIETRRARRRRAARPCAVHAGLHRRRRAPGDPPWCAAHAIATPTEVTIASLVIAVVSDDAERARREVAAQIAFYASAKTYAGLLDTIGFGAEGAAIREAFAVGRLAGDGRRGHRPDDRRAGGRRHRRRCAGAGLRRYEGLLDHVILYVPSFRQSPGRVRESALGLIEACAASAPTEG